MLPGPKLAELTHNMTQYVLAFVSERPKRDTGSEPGLRYAKLHVSVFFWDRDGCLESQLEFSTAIGLDL